MPSFEINAPTTVVELQSSEGGRSGRASLTVANRSNEAATARLEIESAEDLAGAEVRIKGDDHRRLQPNEASEVQIEVAAPEGVSGGTRGFRLRVVNVDRTDEDVTRSPELRFEVPAPPEPAKKPVPWLPIGIAAAVAVLVVGAILVFVLGEDEPQTVSVPNLVGLTAEEATRSLDEHGLTLGEVSLRQTTELSAKEIVDQDPDYRSEVASRSAVSVVVAQPPRRDWGANIPERYRDVPTQYQLAPNLQLPDEMMQQLEASQRRAIEP